MSKKKQELNTRFEKLESQINENQTLLRDLIDFCERTGVLPPMDLTTYVDWRSKLEECRREEQIQTDIKRAKHVLEHNDYIVVKHASELDAAKVKKWVSGKSDIN